MIETDRAAVDTVESELSSKPGELRFLNRTGTYSNSTSLVELARELVDLGETEDALECFGRAITNDRRCWEAYVGRADVVQGLFIMRDEGGSEASLGEWAVADLEMALECVDVENRSLVTRLLTTTYLVSGRYEQAKELALGAVKD